MFGTGEEDIVVFVFFPAIPRPPRSDAGRQQRVIRVVDRGSSESRRTGPNDANPCFSTDVRVFPVT